MSAVDGGRPGDDQQPELDLDLDLDQPVAGDAEVTALFRQSLGPQTGAALDLGAIQRRARRRHRRGQALASGAVSVAAVLAAVLVVASPWSAKGDGAVVPAKPTPSVTQTGPETLEGKVTRAALLRAGDLALAADGGAVLPKSREFATIGAVEDLSAEKKLIAGVCVDQALKVDAPPVGWRQTWTSLGGQKPRDYTGSERVLQWPGAADQAQAAFDELRAQLTDCTAGPGLEGRGVTNQVDWATATTVPVLVTWATDGNGAVLGQGILVWDDALVIVDLDTEGAALGNGTDVAAVNSTSVLLGLAVTRLTGGTPDSRDLSSPLWNVPVASIRAGAITPTKKGSSR